MSSKAVIKSIMPKDSILPNMHPDVYDDFVTYLYERVDLRSFKNSPHHVKMRYYKQFIKTVPVDRLQYSLKLDV